MSFLFGKSKKNQNAALPAASRDVGSSHGPSNSGSMIPTPNGIPDARARNTSNPTPTPGSGSINNSLSSLQGIAQGPRSVESPEPKSLQRPEDQPQRGTMGPPRAPGDSPYPWSARRLNFQNGESPFPRYGASVNASAGKDGSIYIMGGLIAGTTVKGDMWIVDAARPDVPCFSVQGTGDGPGPRVGHASLLVGNAYIVFGGDTKQDENDELDDTLYLLNTSTKHWSRAVPTGPRPSGRYGHTLNILGSKIYIFGGQVEGFFFNDLVAFDLNALQSAQSGWEVLIPNSRDKTTMPQGLTPPARTNHTVVTWDDKLFLFGGTDGVSWFNDVWTYDPRINAWTELDCIGYIPVAREGHAAALVNDTMYVFGGRSKEGQDLNDLAAFRISSRRWYMFQNMGASPTGRSGHSMTAFGRHILVLGGEPSSQAGEPNELSLAYVLDTSKIRYPPNETPAPSAQGPRKTSTSGIPQQKGSVAAARESMMGTYQRPVDPPTSGKPQHASRVPRVAGPGTGLPHSGPPPPQQPPQPRPNGQITNFNQPGKIPMKDARGDNQGYGPAVDGSRGPPQTDGIAPPVGGRGPGPGLHDAPQAKHVEQVTGANIAATAAPPSVVPIQKQPEATQHQQKRSMESARSNSAQAVSRAVSKTHKAQHSADSVEQGTPRASGDIVRNHPIDSGVGSSPAVGHQNGPQNEELVRELEAAKSRNAWYASELALARKAGYQPNSSGNQVLDERAAEAFGDDDKPLIEALLKMRAELAKVTGSIDAQAVSAANKIAEVERQRDAAISEAVYAKAKLAAHGGGGGGSQAGTPQDGTRGAGSPDLDRVNDINRRLAHALATQNEMSTRIENMRRDIEAERRAKELAEETAEAAQRQAQELEQYKQRNAMELESLRAGVHELERVAREESANSAEARATSRLLAVDKHELGARLKKALDEAQNHMSVLNSLRDAVTASSDKANMLERKLDEERVRRTEAEHALTKVKSEYEDKTRGLVDLEARLRDSEEMAEKHANEAQAHRQAVLSGLDKAATRDIGEGATAAADERVTILQQQIETANAMVRQNQKAADAASEKLRRAEERIAGLEAYQEQSSRESLSMRKQLQQAVREAQAHHSEKAEVQQLLEKHQLDSNALEVQLKTLKDLLDERGVSAAEQRRSRALDSPNARYASPENARVRELEQQLESTMKINDEMRSTFEQREQEVSKEWEEKLAALTNDHQAAVKYVRGTEKMLSKMMHELDRYKNNNNKLEKEIHELRHSARDVSTERSANWDAERDNLRGEISKLQSSLKTSMANFDSKLYAMQTDLSNAQRDRDTASARANELETTMANARAELDAMQQENAVLDERARHAEQRVQMFLDQFETSVDNYRRQSQMTITSTHGGAGGGGGVNGAGGGHVPHDSISTESIFTDDGDSLSNHRQSTLTDGHSRNSMALDHLASELDALRSHWETTNKAYRLSDRFDYDRSAPAGSDGKAELSESFSAWKRKMDAEEAENKGPVSSATAAK